jgi:hypothetical protein
MAQQLTPREGRYPLRCGGSIIFEGFRPRYVTSARNRVDRAAILAEVRADYGLALDLAEWRLGGAADYFAIARVRGFRALD